MGTDHLALVATSCIDAALATSCATPAYEGFLQWCAGLGWGTKPPGLFGTIKLVQ